MDLKFVVNQQDIVTLILTLMLSYFCFHSRCILKLGKQAEGSHYGGKVDVALKEAKLLVGY